METTGLDGQHHDGLGGVQGLEHPGPGPGPLGPFEPDPGHRHVVAEPHEVLLEADLGAVDQLQPGAEGVVGDRHQPDAQPPGAGQLAR